MSDFYRRRRVVIKDATALLTFFLGFVWSGAFAWPFLADQVDQGDMIRGLAYFLSLVLGTGIVMGFIGLEAGNLLGGVWERYHKHHRHDREFAIAGASSTIAWTGATPIAPVRRAPTSGASARRDVSNVYYDEAGVYAASFIPLAERVRPVRYEMAKVREALARTTNIGAWDGGRLVGAVRLLSDGYTFSVIADILVDPDYQRLGIGRNLMSRALAAAPDARVLIEAQPDCIGFFERIGCVRGPTGFTFTGAPPQ
ncbi:MAG TPA: GNAT family N-acetyltransferase [Gemmatimonadaceae bacterium]|nr:GNAT family N-acetyltransferase [Gemmatimonadaceae bacterium]